MKNKKKETEKSLSEESTLGATNPMSRRSLIKKAALGVSGLAVGSILPLSITDASAATPNLLDIETAGKRLTIIRQSPAYWRVVIGNPPLSLFDPVTFAELNVLMDDIEKDKNLKVIVFESADKDFFMNHHDVDNRIDVPNIPGAMPFFGNWPKFVTRLAQSSVISIAKVRGRAWAQGFEFALACDMRFASKERAKFALIEVGGSSIPGGGGIEWLAALVGRSRTLEIVCSADEFDAEIGEHYGFVNRSLPDAELDAYVDALATRMSRFEKRALETGKKMVNARAGVPSEGDLWNSNHILHGVDEWPESQKAYKKMKAAGLGKVGDFELNFAERLGNLPID